jgi:cytochrome b involved in lipid metabolism
MEPVILLLKNKKYDVTHFLDLHPGGKQCLINNNNKDVMYHYKMHSKKAQKLWKKYKIK